MENDRPWTGSNRVAKWLLHNDRGLGRVTWNAAELLDERLRIRKRAAAAFIGFAVLALAVICISASTSDTTANDTAVRWWVVTMTLIAVAPLIALLVISIGERRMMARLSRRVTSGVAWTPMTLFGGVRTGNLLLLVVTDIAVLIALPAIDAPSDVQVSFDVASVITMACVAVSVWRLLTMPAIAVDKSSLAIDQRLRSNDLYMAGMPLGVLAAGAATPINLLTSTSGTLSMISEFVPFIFCVYLGLETVARGRQARRHEPGSGQANPTEA